MFIYINIDSNHSGKMPACSSEAQAYYKQTQSASAERILEDNHTLAANDRILTELQLDTANRY